jgi:hypothetical protein
MNLAMYKLSRLVENEDNLHQELEGGAPGRIHYAEMIADIPYYMKIECKDGGISPVSVSVEDTKSKNGKVLGVSVYGSFRIKEPTADKNDFEIKDP